MTWTNSKGETALEILDRIGGYGTKQETWDVGLTSDTNILQDQLRPGFWYLNKDIALFHLIIEKDIHHAKQHFYNCGLIAEYLNKVYEHSWLGHGLYYMLYTVMSDNTDIIERVAHLKLKPDQQKIIAKNAGVVSLAIQNVIKDDWEQLNENIETLKVFATRKKPKVKYPENYINIFEALRNSDSNKVEDVLLNGFESSNVNRMKKANESYEQLISQETLGFAKLAHFKNLTIEIESELVPAEMIPFKPLDRYDIPYWFLSENGEY